MLQILVGGHPDLRFAPCLRLFWSQRDSLPSCSQALDANGQPATRTQAKGGANPCRHCLQLIREGDDMLILAHRPFSRVQPYAEVGPIFLHQHACPRHESPQLPAWFANLQPALVRGYGHDDCIRYDTGQALPGTDLSAACERILRQPEVAYVHVRSKFGCFQCRVERV